jgi:glycosyltransferase involved in cell wall biosynthesis
MTDRSDPPTAYPRVLMIGHASFPNQPGGLDRYVRELYVLLEEAHVVVVGAPDPGAGERMHALSGPGRPLPLRLWTLTREIRKQARAAEIIDVHFALYAFVPMLLGAFRAKTVVVHFHGPWADENTDDGDRSRWRLRARRALERYVYRRASLAITLSGAFKRVLVERYGVSPWRVEVVGPGVDLDRFTPGDRAGARARLSLPDDAFVVCCARRLVARMGHRVLLEAWSTLLAGGGVRGRQLRLLIAGEGELGEQLSQEITAAGMSDSVSLLGRVSDEQLADIYRAADVNVVPSVASEGFGLVVLEAAACGTPSIATSIGGLPEALGGLDSSLIVAPADPDALAQRLAAAAQGQLPDRARTRAWAQRNRWDAVAARHRELYAQLLAGTRRRRIRVAYVGHVAQLSGGEIALVRLIAALDDVDAHVILAQEGPLVGRLLAAGASVEVLPLPERTRDLRKGRVRFGTLPLTAVWDAAIYVPRLARRLRRVRADIVHTNTLKAGIYGSLAAHLARIPTVWHVRDRIAPDYLERPAVLLLRALIATLPNGVLTNSEATRSTLWSAPESTRVVHSIVRDPIASPPTSAVRSDGGPFVVGMVGRIAVWKGQDVLLAAFAQAFAGGSEVLTIVGEPMFGEAEKRYDADLRGLALTLGIADRVDFRGFREDVWAELAQMDLFVHASVTPEPFGQVIVEAMLAGVPVIAAASGGPTEVLTDGIDGVLYRPGDVDALASALRRLRDDPDLRAQLRASARKRAEQFSPEVAAATVMSLYGHVLTATAGRRE